MEYPNRHWVEHIRGPSWRPLGRTPAEEPPILMRLTTFSRIVYPSSSTTTTTSSMSSSARPVGRTRNRHQNAIPDPRAHFVPLRAYLVNSVASPTQKSANPNHTPLVSQPNLSVRIRPAKTSRKRARDPTPLPSSSSSARNNDNPWFPANKRQRSSTLAEIVSAHQDDVNRVQAAAALLGLRTEELVEKQKLAGKKYATRSADAAASTAYNPPTTQQQQQRSSPNKSKPLRRSSRLSKRS